MNELTDEASDDDTYDPIERMLFNLPPDMASPSARAAKRVNVTVEGLRRLQKEVANLETLREGSSVARECGNFDLEAQLNQEIDRRIKTIAGQLRQMTDPPPVRRGRTEFNII